METASIAIRPAHRDDFVALLSVASLDSALVPSEPLLVAEADGAIVAALSLASGETIADPFRRSGAAVDLLRLRASQMERADRRSRPHPFRRLRGRPALRAA